MRPQPVGFESDFQWHIFTHGAFDNHLHQLVFTNPNSTAYTDATIDVGPTPLPNSPIAAVSWGQMSALQVYYFTNVSTLQALYWSSDEPGWQVSAPLGNVLPGSVTLYAQASTIGDAQALDEIRIGYQSQADPETITEAYYTASFGSWRTRVLGGTPELD
ncbi:hypothetical protein DFH29DRAFT_133842 [Suillus ampliporus]|nr:hypothetical protein DFH29DRAFT_133842 [Suillus ampliporus]